MNKSNGKLKKNTRISTRKALMILNDIEKKFSIDEIKTAEIGEEKKALFQMKLLQFRENVKNIRFNQHLPEWGEEIRLARNRIGHQIDDFTDEDFEKIFRNFIAKIKTFQKDLEENIRQSKHPSQKKRKFETFASPSIGTPEERKQLIDAMEDTFCPIDPTEISIEFPQNFFSKETEKTVQQILHHGSVENDIKRHPGLSENIQTDVLQWIQDVNKKLELENPFWEEEYFIEKQKSVSATDLAMDISDEKSKIELNYNNLPSISASQRGNIAESKLDFNFYKKQFIALKETSDTADSIGWKSLDQLEILRRNFISDMEKNLIERKNQWELEKIDEWRKQFLEVLYNKIKQFMKIEKLLSPLINHFGRLWDLSSATFDDHGFEILETFSQLLEQDESLQELAAVLGKHSRAQSFFEKELRNKTVIKTEWHSQPAYRGEIKGIKYSNDLSSIIPSELALLRNPATKKLFQLKFSQKQLLSYDYRNRQQYKKEEIEKEEVSVEKKEPKGPIIVCVDTSGSMRGSPENIAKTITFALAKMANEEERKCYLISFSTNIETLDMSNFSSGDSIAKLVEFLRKSFYGGTDAAPALHHAIKMLQKEGYKNADVLMISDFVMNNLSAGVIKIIEQEKEKNTCFYSLVIGTTGNSSAIKCFNHNWTYDSTSPNAARRLIEQLHEIKMR